MARRYIAVIGDVVASRSAAERSQMQDHIRQALGEVNDRFADQVVAQFLITIGDEFQGLLRAAGGLDRLLALLRSRANPAELRFGLGLGRLATPLRSEAIGMDGPCFHRARAAVERAKARGTMIEVGMGGENAALDIYSILYSELRRRWTRKQRYVLDLAQTGLEGKEIAKLLEISPSAVSQHLTAAGHEAVSRATGAWLATLQTVFETDEYAPEAS
jgi:hypothetical protein